MSESEKRRAHASAGARKAGRANNAKGPVPRLGNIGVVPLDGMSLRSGTSPARGVAFALLQQIETGDAHSDVLLRSHAVSALSQRDRNLVTTLVMGTLRWQIALDAAILPLLRRPDEPLPVQAQVSLRLGAFQLLHLERIPVHAAVNESVELCRAAGQPQAAAMVNAVLRRLLRERNEGQDRAPIFETTARFAERLGHPLWLVDRWVRAYGRAAAMAICEAGQRAPRRGLLLTPWERPAMNERDEERNFSTAADYPHSSQDAAEPPVRSPANEEPWDAEDVEVLARNSGSETLAGSMDDGSRLVAEFAAAAAPGAARVWDCCAAPGGKTAVLLHRLPAASVLASDISERRLAALETRLTLAGIARDRWRGVVCAAELLPASEGEFDLVLCDVPCSGTGTLSRNPEIRHRLRSADLQRHAERQREILGAALRRVAHGGRLVYSTCSLEGEECESVIKEIESRGWRVVPAQDLLHRLQGRDILRNNIAVNSLLAGDAVRTLPGVHPCDGFYAVVLERA